MRFYKFEISVLKRKAVHEFLFLYYTKCVYPDDGLLICYTIRRLHT